MEYTVEVNKENETLLMFSTYYNNQVKQLLLW